VLVGVFVGVSLGVLVGVSVFVGVGVSVLVAVFVGVCVGVSVGVFVGVSVGVSVFVGVGVSVLVGVFVGVVVLVGVGVGVGVGGGGSQGHRITSPLHVTPEPTTKSSGSVSSFAHAQNVKLVSPDSTKVISLLSPKESLKQSGYIIVAPSLSVIPEN
jgi:hypothetical protein